MKRAPFVIGATGAGLGLLLSFHTKALHVSIASSAAPPASGQGSGTSSTSSPNGSATTTPSSVPSGPTSSATTTPPATFTRSASSQDVQYRYGDLQLEVTKKGSQITNIQITTDNATDPRSAEINSQALPMLQQQAMSAQSANIDGVSGATFTSQAYAYALQQALDQLK